MKIYFSTNPFIEDSYEIYENINLIDFLQSKFDKFPDSGRIYHNTVSLSNDVTPKNKNDIEKLIKLDGEFFVIIYPGDPISIVVAVIAVAAAAATAFLLKPKIPSNVSTDVQSDVGSSNNQLGSRQNKANLNGRVPDIYGQVRSIPDLIALPYTYFDSAGLEYELSYMCVGRGYYDISDIKEGKSVYNSTVGGYSFYEPGNSPISGIPYITGGQSITDDFYNFNRLADLNGDTLPVPGTGTLSLGANPTISGKTLGLTYTRIVGLLTRVNTNNLIIVYPKGTNPSPADTFSIGSSVTVTSSSNPSLNGGYTVAAAGDTAKIKTFSGSTSSSDIAWTIELTPKKDNTNNGNVLIHPPVGSDYYAYDWVANQVLTIESTNSALIGPYLIDDITATDALVNFIAPSGIYGGSNIQVKVTVTPYPSGTPVQTTFTLTPKTNFNGFKGYTARFTLPGKCYVTFERLTAKLTVDTDEIKIKDFYYGKLLTGTYSDVTTVLVLSKQTQTATSSQERKFNCLAYRKIPTRISGNTFSTTLTATNNAAEIICSICLDQFIGRRSISELDVDNIYNTINEVYLNFGPSGNINDVRMFNYTFDKLALSFEETLAMIASSIHCIAYRQANKIKLNFDKIKPITTMLFNHKNIIPNSMQRAVSFGIINDYDGIKFKYIDPINEQENILYIPNDTIVNPKDIEIAGIRSKIQAYYLAWRAWNRLKYQNIALKFEATQESDLLVINDRLLVSDLTRNDIYCGEITSHVGLTLTLSVDVNVSNGDVIFLQYANGIVGNKIIQSQLNSNTITIQSPPDYNLITDVDSYSKTTFIIQRATDVLNLPFILTDKTPSDNFSNELTLINYTENYYLNDHDNPNSI